MDTSITPEVRTVLIVCPPQKDTRESGVAVLCYKGNGISERLRLQIGAKDFDDKCYSIIIPDNVVGITSSYVEGLLCNSIINLTKEEFNNKYKFECVDEYLMEKLNESINFLYTEKAFDLLMKNKKENTSKGKFFTRTFAISLYLIVSSLIAVGISANTNNDLLLLTQAPVLFIGLLTALVYTINYLGVTNNG